MFQFGTSKFRYVKINKHQNSIRILRDNDITQSPFSIAWKFDLYFKILYQKLFYFKSFIG